MTPYTQFIQANHKFRLLSAIYRDRPEGVKRIIILDRTLTQEAFTEDGGVKLNEVDRLAHKMLTKNNSKYLYHVVFHKDLDGYVYSLYGRTRHQSRIQDILVDVLTAYGAQISASREIIREYF